ncbi:MAG: methyltransferase domain-containing protein [Pseudomonadota bacterium]
MTGIDRYDYAFDPVGESWPARLLRQVEPGAKVLELGPGPGAMTRVLKDRGHRVVTVERDPGALPLLRALGVSVIEADLNETSSWLNALGDERFDTVLACDVFEHLVRPDEVLKALTKVMHPQGHLIVSVPNVAHVGLMASLRLGHFDYVDKGLLDATHLRFFTRRSFERLLLENAWLPIHIEAHEVAVEDTEFAWLWERLPQRWRDVFRTDWDEAEVYQWMVVATSAGSDGQRQRLARELTDVRYELDTVRRELQALRKVHDVEHRELVEHQKAFAEAKAIIGRLERELQEARDHIQSLEQTVAATTRSQPSAGTAGSSWWRRWFD